MIVQCVNVSCRIQLEAPNESIGQRVCCPTCGVIFVWPGSVLKSCDFVIYDLETTGLYPDADEFIQIAAIRFRNGRPIGAESFFSYAKPSRSISSFIQSYTGISNQDVKNAPRPSEVLKQFSAFVGGDVLIAHNGLRFDSKFLASTCHRNQLPHRKVDAIDSIWLSKEVFGRTKGLGHGLDRVVERCRISSKGIKRHDARGDVELLGRAVAFMWEKIGLDSSAAGFRRHETLLPHV